MDQPTLRVAAAQIRSTGDREDNLAQALDGVRRAAEAGAALVVLPEATSHWFGSDVRPAAEPLDGPFATALREAAAEASITVVAGLFEPADDPASDPRERVHNTLLVTGPAGEGSYRKVHLFDAFGSRESDVVAPGSAYVVAPVADGVGGTVSVGLATCYDVRFADQFTALGRAGADLVVLPASWGAGPGKVEQWQTLTRARALDAQAWLLAAGQAWQESRGTAALGVGHSCLVDPFGRVVAELDGEPGLLVGDVDLAVVREARNRIPVLAGTVAVAGVTTLG
ncbi:carbon-nitrogen hydrolase family protein [Alteromonas gracilis]